MEIDMHDTELRERLAAMEGRVPPVALPALEAAQHRHHFSLSLSAAALLILVLAATAGAVAVGNLTAVHGYPGIENPGQPLAGAQMECMTPPQAAAFLAARGYTVVWQVESGTPKAGGTSLTTATPPEHGYVVPGAILEDGKLHMVVDQTTGALGVGACYGMPMP
jgi:hypothetical protein